MRICYHGTNEENAQSILKEGFRPESWFARHLEDAIEKGGIHVFQVAFDDPPDHWQFSFEDTWIKPDRIVSYKIYRVEQKIENEALRKEVFDSPKIPPNRAAAWRSFDYSKWKEKNDKFDHETWNKILDEGMDKLETRDGHDDDWVKILCDSRNKADEACGGSPPFRPNASYNATGDILEVSLSDEMYYAKWLNHQVSVLLCHKTDEVVGFQIWEMSGVKSIKELSEWLDKTNLKTDSSTKQPLSKS